MRRAALLLLILFGLCAPLSAEDDKFVLPEQTILGLEEAIPLGELGILSPSPIKKPPKYFVSASYTWKILENGKEKKRIRIDKDGTVSFGTGLVNKEMTAVLVCTYIYKVPTDKDHKEEEVGARSRIIISTIKIGSGPQPQPPQPGPRPGPDPTPSPSGKYNLAKQAYQWAMNIGVTADKRNKSAQALAKSFRGVASSISAGALKDIKEILLASKKSNQTAMNNAGVEISEWSGWSNSLKKALYELYKDNKISTAQDFATAFNEIADGLEKVK